MSFVLFQGGKDEDGGAAQRPSCFFAAAVATESRATM
jgi:hypothetical protein